MLLLETGKVHVHFRPFGGGGRTAGGRDFLACLVRFSSMS